MLQLLGDFVPGPLLWLCPGPHSGTSGFRPKIHTFGPLLSKNFSNPALHASDDVESDMQQRVTQLDWKCRTGQWRTCS